MIQSYGVHWHLDRVFWGRPKVAGTLLGAASQSARARDVDFRNQRGIYALYAGYDLVYVGQTGAGNDRLFNRLKCHKIDHLSERWDRFSWFGLLPVSETGALGSLPITYDAAKMIPALEAILIEALEPREPDVAPDRSRSYGFSGNTLTQAAPAAEL